MKEIICKFKNLIFGDKNLIRGNKMILNKQVLSIILFIKYKFI